MSGAVLNGDENAISMLVSVNAQMSDVKIPGVVMEDMSNDIEGIEYRDIMAIMAFIIICSMGFVIARMIFRFVIRRDDFNNNILYANTEYYKREMKSLSAKE